MDHIEAFVPVIAFFVAFLVGSIPFGRIVARIFRGRAEPTALWPVRTLAMILSVLKGALPVFLTFPVGVTLWSGVIGLPGYAFSLSAVWAIGLFTLLGHCYSPWEHFKGGKGVVTGFGVLLLLSPAAALVGLLTYVLSYLSRRHTALSSLSGVLVAAVAHVVFHPIGSYLWAGAACVLLIMIRHESDIDELLQEPDKTA